MLHVGVDNDNDGCWLLSREQCKLRRYVREEKTKREGKRVRTKKRGEEMRRAPDESREKTACCS